GQHRGGLAGKEDLLRLLGLAFFALRCVGPAKDNPGQADQGGTCPGTHLAHPFGNQATSWPACAVPVGAAGRRGPTAFPPRLTTSLARGGTGAAAVVLRAACPTPTAPGAGASVSFAVRHHPCLGNGAVAGEHVGRGGGRGNRLGKRVAHRRRWWGN